VSDIAALRALGGDVVPSFGGWSADQGGTEIGDSCNDSNAIAAAYESVVTTYGVTRLDMDIEGRSLTRTDGIDRRNKAIKLLQDWATSQGRTVQVVYTCRRRSTAWSPPASPCSRTPSPTAFASTS
jgi:chitinase